MPATWNGNQFKQGYKQKAIGHLWRMCYYVEAQAKMIITEKIYDQPQRGNYKRTGLLRSSIHSVVNEMLMYGLVGTSVFYAIWVEFGHTLRNGRFWKGIAFLRPALDRLRAKLR